MPPQAVLADVIRIARQLSPLEKARLIEELAPDVEAALASASGAGLRRRSLRGAFRGGNISAADIDAARREMWQNFPREDI